MLIFPIFFKSATKDLFVSAVIVGKIKRSNKCGGVALRLPGGRQGLLNGAASGVRSGKYEFSLFGGDVVVMQLCSLNLRDHSSSERSD